jgi:hypothetical protein
LSPSFDMVGSFGPGGVSESYTRLEGFGLAFKLSL